MGIRPTGQAPNNAVVAENTPIKNEKNVPDQAQVSSNSSLRKKTVTTAKMAGLIPNLEGLKGRLSELFRNSTVTKLTQIIKRMLFNKSEKTEDKMEVFDNMFKESPINYVEIRKHIDSAESEDKKNEMNAKYEASIKQTKNLMAIKASAFKSLTPGVGSYKHHFDEINNQYKTLPQSEKRAMTDKLAEKGFPGFEEVPKNDKEVYKRFNQILSPLEPEKSTALNNLVDVLDATNFKAYLETYLQSNLFEKRDLIQIASLFLPRAVELPEDERKEMLTSLSAAIIKLPEDERKEMLTSLTDAMASNPDWMDTLISIVSEATRTENLYVQMGEEIEKASVEWMGQVLFKEEINNGGVLFDKVDNHSNPNELHEKLSREDVKESFSKLKSEYLEKKLPDFKRTLEEDAVLFLISISSLSKLAGIKDIKRESLTDSFKRAAENESDKKLKDKLLMIADQVDPNESDRPINGLAVMSDLLKTGSDASRESSGPSTPGPSELFDQMLAVYAVTIESRVEAGDRFRTDET